MKKIIIILILMITVQILNSKDIPPCSCVPKFYLDKLGREPINQDTLIVFDTCGIVDPSKDCDTIFWHKYYLGDRKEGFKRCMSKGTWKVYFPDSTINLPKYRHDTTIFVDWEEIDTNKREIRKVFQELEQKFGHYQLIKDSPELTHGDLSQLFDLYFDNWQKTRTIEFEVVKAPGVICEFNGYPIGGGNSINEDIQDNKFKYFIMRNSSNIIINSSGELIINYAIYDIIGNCMLNVTENMQLNIVNIDISFLQNGLYFLKINNQFSKFIVKR